MKANKVYMKRSGDTFIGFSREDRGGNETLFVDKDKFVDKIYDWLEKETLVADYISRDSFKKSMDKIVEKL